MTMMTGGQAAVEALKTERVRPCVRADRIGHHGNIRRII